MSEFGGGGGDGIDVAHHTACYSSQGMVCAMSLSPSGSLLATTDVSSRLCLWEVPSFKLKRAWESEDQVHLSLFPHRNVIAGPVLKKKGKA